MTDTPTRAEGNGTHRGRTPPNATGIVAPVHAVARIDRRADLWGEVG